VAALRLTEHAGREAGELSRVLIGGKSEDASDNSSSGVYGGLGYRTMGGMARRTENICFIYLRKLLRVVSHL
jgi:hypothetical protein